MKKYITIIAALAAMMSCQKEGPADVQGDNQIVFEFGLPATKATAENFEAGDKVSVWAVEYTTDETPELQIGGNYLNNEVLTYDGSKWTGRTMYWSEKSCDFYAIYPSMDLTSIDEHLFEIDADQNTSKSNYTLGGYEASDVLWAKTNKVSRSDGIVGLHFEHIMSKCIVTITRGEKFEGEIPDDIVCHIYNTITTAKLNFACGSVEKYAQAPRKTITMKKISNDRFEAVVVPQHIELSTPLIEVTMGGIAYLLEYSLSFKPGYAHTINLILNTSPDQEKIEISIDADAGGWKE